MQLIAMPFSHWDRQVTASRQSGSPFRARFSPRPALSLPPPALPVLSPAGHLARYEAIFGHFCVQQLTHSCASAIGAPAINASARIHLLLIVPPKFAGTSRR